jgi:hypothetical protein
MNDNDNNEDIDLIKRDIESTRQRISSEIDAIEGKLTPAHAKDVVTEAVKEKIVETKDRIGERIEDTAHVVREQATRAANVVRDEATHAAHVVRDEASRVGGDIIHTVRANPVPLALIGIGAGWLAWETFGPNRRPRGYYASNGDRRLGAGYGSRSIYGESAYGRDDELYGTATSYASGSLEGRGTYEDYSTGSVEPRGRRFAAGQKVSQAAHDVRDKARHLASDARDRAAHLAEGTRDKASHLVGETRDKASHLAFEARERANILAMRSRERVTHAGDFVTTRYDATPLAFGALALAVGVGIGLALPHTRREDQVLGQARGRVVERAKQLADQAAHVAVDSVREGASAAKETAKKALEGGTGTEPKPEESASASAFGSPGYGNNTVGSR